MSPCEPVVGASQRTLLTDLDAPAYGVWFLEPWVGLDLGHTRADSRLGKPRVSLLGCDS